MPFAPAMPGSSKELIGFDRAVASQFGSVLNTPDPNTFAKASRYKWEPYSDTNWRCTDYFLPKKGHALVQPSR